MLSHQCCCEEDKADSESPLALEHEWKMLPESCFTKGCCEVAGTVVGWRKQDKCAQVAAEDTSSPGLERLRSVRQDILTPTQD